MRVTIVFDGDEAGGQASAKALEVLSSWGCPRHPAEPDSQVTAMLEREISRLGQIAEAHAHEPPDEARDRRLAEAEWGLDVVTEYWREERSRADRITSHTQARTADEYATLEATASVVQPRRTIDYKAIKERISIADHIARFTSLRRTGRTLTGSCPLPDHDDSTPSLTVYPETRSFYCFGCRRGGDVIDFAAYMGTTDL